MTTQEYKARRAAWKAKHPVDNTVGLYTDPLHPQGVWVTKATAAELRRQLRVKRAWRY